MTAISRQQARYNRILALNGENMPDEIEADGIKWLRLKTFKHDFFAATGLYESRDGDRQAVLKIFRPYSYKGLPYGWLSRWEARHEEKIYLKLQDTGHVPGWIGRYGKTGIMHEFIPGHDLLYGADIKFEFFDQVDELLEVMHRRGLAYLDTNKPDNILVGDDGRAYLIDFQITWLQPFFPLNILTWPLFTVFKDSDLYHMMKHRRKFFPDKVSREALDRRRPWYIKIHRAFANPIRYWRRRYLRSVETQADSRPEGHARH